MIMGGHVMRRAAITSLLAVLLAGCSAAQAPAASAPTAPVSDAVAAADQRFPDIVGVEVSGAAPGYSFAVTVSSPYDTPDRYADAFRVRGEDGTVFGVNELTHDHATEQPFTRTLSDVAVPGGVARVVVEGRDRANGWGGGTRTVELPG